MRWHPDRNPGDKRAGEKFRLIKLAWDVLGDSAKRATYDATGVIPDTRKTEDLKEVMTLIHRLFHDVVNPCVNQQDKTPWSPKANKVDFIARLKERLRQHISEAEKVLYEAKESLGIWQDLQPRFRAKDGCDNLLGDIAKTPIRDYEQLIEDVSKKLEIANRCFNILGDHMFEVDGTPIPKREKLSGFTVKSITSEDIFDG